jgi:putative membrane protein
LAHAITTVAAAIVLWTAIFSSSALLAFLVLFATGVQMSLLGALPTFAAVPLFSVHEFTTAAWGLSMPARDYPQHAQVTELA